MATQAVKQINAYRMTNADINDAIAFINSGYVLFPAGMNARQRARMNQKFGAGTGFAVGGGQLRYNPKSEYKFTFGTTRTNTKYSSKYLCTRQ